MKRWLVLTVLFFLFSCDFSIPPVVFTFINNSTFDVTVTPEPNEDWVEFIIPVGEQMTVESSKSNIFFSLSPDSVQYTDYDSSTYTYTLVNDTDVAP